MVRFVADLGNTRLKWAAVSQDGELVDKVALPLEPGAWEQAWNSSPALADDASSWAVATVNPPLAAQLAAFLDSKGVREIIWFDTAAQIPLRFDVEGADTGGADRALAVAAAIRLMPAGRAGLVVSCGTAITVERITALGVWQGGVIAPGLGMSARALHLLTAQLPVIDVRNLDPACPPAPWGRSTRTSLEAGLFWGTVGALRELIARQADDIGSEPWVIWSGGDAPLLARFASGIEARVEPNLVLIGLAHAAFPSA
jgi:type III pantothenate kinase